MTGKHAGEVQFIGRCAPCDKGAFATRKAARRWARTHLPNERQLRAYRCPIQPDVWHYGHNLPIGLRGLRRRGAGAS